MASIVLAAAGASIGAGFGGTILGLSGAVIGQAAGSIIGTIIDSRIIASFAPNQISEGARLESLRVTSSTEGAVIPNVYGRMKIGGNIFWATDFLEKSTTTTQGGSGKGGGGGEVKTTAYSYSCSFAVGLCEGPISGIGRIWVDGKPFDVPGAVWRVYTGTETQAPDPFITAKMGAGNAPAYRGIAYVVFEELPLEKFGNRIPQLSFEVIRPTLADGSAESLIRAVNLIPGAGEFVYATETITRSSNGTTVPENQNSTLGKADLPASLDNLEQVAPNLESVSLVVSWFGTDLRAGSCLIQPGIETTTKTTSPKSWAVNGVTRTGAHLISQVSGAAAFGGTPADFAVVQAIQDLRARGKRITFYPFVMMDVPAGNTLPNPYSANAATLGQPVYPWRGRITVSPASGQTGTADKTGAAATQIAAFFGAASAASFSTSGTTVSWTGSPSEWGYRRMVLHYAKLCSAAGGVDSFLIGSELRGLTMARSAASTYPAVAALQTLAADCRAILGPGTKIGYAADWSEYFGHQPGDGTGDIYFHLDPLWADANINFIGIDNYLPLSDWRDGTGHVDASGAWSGIHDPTYLQSNIEGGEYFDWFYASDAARNTQTRTPITDGAYGKPWVFRPKDFRSWWTNSHKNRPGGVESASATAWVPQSKPIRFTEIGCPAVDNGTNEPNEFFDPKSSESELPYFSSGARDDAIQRRYLEALIGYWSDPGKNPISTVYAAPMIDMSECAVWCWDARPYPAWPGRDDVWGDTANWEVGHWLNGRLGNASLGDLVRSICTRSGIDPNALDVSRLADAVPGFVIAALESPRASIAPLARYFGFDAVESQGLLRFVPRGGSSVATITAVDLVAAEKAEGEDIEFTRSQETELPRVLKWRMLSADEDFEAVTVEARRVNVDSVRVQAEQFAIAHPPATADRNARRALFDAWIGRETATFALPPSRLALDPTDVVSVENDGRSLDFALTQIADGEARRVEASRRDQTVYGLPEGPSRGVSTAVPVVYGPPDAEILDLPQLSEDIPAYRPLVAVAASPWYGQAAVWRSASLDGFSLFSTASVPAQFGTLAAALAVGPYWRFDLANALLLDISSGSLQSVTDEQLFAGANALALETATGIWEVLQFGQATIVTTGRWKLTRLLRGQSGTEDAIVPTAPIGSRIVFLGASLVPLPVTEAELGMPWNWRIGPVDRAAGDAINLALAFTPQGRGLRPWSPVRIKGVWQGSGDITLSWLRRTRSLAGDSWNAPEVPLGETTESWDIEILNGGGAMVRTVSGIGATTWTYTAAMQTADFGALATSLRLRVFQNGQLGRGAPAETILTP
jgi:hypothetical protein